MTWRECDSARAGARLTRRNGLGTVRGASAKPARFVVPIGCQKKRRHRGGRVAMGTTTAAGGVAAGRAAAGRGHLRHLCNTWTSSRRRKQTLRSHLVPATATIRTTFGRGCAMIGAPQRLNRERPTVRGASAGHASSASRARHRHPRRHLCHRHPNRRRHRLLLRQLRHAHRCRHRRPRRPRHRHLCRDLHHRRPHTSRRARRHHLRSSHHHLRQPASSLSSGPLSLGGSPSKAHRRPTMPAYTAAVARTYSA